MNAAAAAFDQAAEKKAENDRDALARKVASEKLKEAADQAKVAAAIEMVNAAKAKEAKDKATEAKDKAAEQAAVQAVICPT